jgi:hypothetical protein
MQPSTIGASYVNPFSIWINLALKTTEMLWASSQVITHRTGRMMLSNANPNLSDRRELVLMGQEKIDAAIESARAMGAYIAKWQIQFGVLAINQMMANATAIASLATSRNPGQVLGHQARLVRDAVTAPAIAASKLASSAAHLSHHAIKPIHSRAIKNAKRLAKR